MPWPPALLLVGVAAVQLAVSLLAHDYARYGLLVHEASVKALSVVLLTAGALVALLPGVRARAVASFDALGAAPRRSRLLWLGAAYAGVFLWLGFFHFCTYRRYLLVNDTAFSVNLAHNFIRFGTLEHTMFGAHALSIHFMLLMALFSPVLLVWNDPLALIAVQHALVCSVPFAAYALAARQTASSAAGTAALLLTLCSPYFHDLVGSNLHIASLAAFLPWGLYFLGEGKRAPFLLCFALMLCTYETAAFALAGYGVYVFFGEGRRRAGLAVTAAAAALFLLELAVTRSFEAREPLGIGPVGRFSMFSHLVPPGVAPEDALGATLLRPWGVLRHVVSSPYLYFPLLRVLVFAGFFPLWSPAQLVLWVAVLPQFLSGRGEVQGLLAHIPKTYHDFGGHHAAFLIGPLAFATALGVAAFFRRRPGGRDPRAALLAAGLLFGGLGLRYTQVWTNTAFMPRWFDAMPRVLAQVPPRARVWADDNVTPHLANRRWLRLINYSAAVSYELGYQKLFKPDYVVLDKAWVDFARSPNREVLLTYWSKNGFIKAAEDSDVLLLRSPSPAPRPDDVPEWVALPEADVKAAAAYAAYLLAEGNAGGRAP